MKEFLDALCDYEDANRKAAGVLLRYLESERGRPCLEEDIDKRIAPTISAIYNILDSGREEGEDGIVTFSFILIILGLTASNAIDKFRKHVDSLKVDGINRR